MPLLHMLKDFCSGFSEVLFSATQQDRLAAKLLLLRLSAKAAPLTLGIFPADIESCRATGVGAGPGPEAVWYARQDSNL